MFISKLFTLIKYVDLYKKHNNNELPIPSLFSEWQLNGNTLESSNVFKNLIKNNYHYNNISDLNNKATELTNKLIKLLNLHSNELLPVFIDEAQTFTGNSCLNGKF